MVTVYQDRSFSFITKTPPAAVLLKRAAGIAKGSGEPNRMRVGKVTVGQVEEIAQLKMKDLNAVDIAAARRSSSRERPGAWASKWPDDLGKEIRDANHGKEVPGGEDDGR